MDINSLIDALIRELSNYGAIADKIGNIFVQSIPDGLILLLIIILAMSCYSLSVAQKLSRKSEAEYKREIVTLAAQNSDLKFTCRNAESRLATHQEKLVKSEATNKSLTAELNAFKRKQKVSVSSHPT